MYRFQQICHFMHYDIFKTFLWFLGKISIDADEPLKYFPMAELLIVHCLTLH